MKDELGDRMKAYESAEAQRRLPHDQPLIARLDGRSFSKFTKGFEKPFDRRLTAAMDRATAALVEETKAAIGYTQSDEITLIWPGVEEQSQRFFDDRAQKLCSVLASKCAVEFHWALREQFLLSPAPALQDRLQIMKPHFDCRVWTVPDEAEASNTLLWRCQDARKNAVSIFTRQYLSHKAMQGLDQQGMLEAAYAAGAPKMEDAITVGEHYGRYFKRVTERRRLSEDEWERIPMKHRPERDHEFERSSVKQLGWGYFGQFQPTESRIGAIFE